jgi:hypothetical protein
MCVSSPNRGIVLENEHRMTDTKTFLIRLMTMLTKPFTFSLFDPG